MSAPSSYESDTSVSVPSAGTFKFGISSLSAHGHSDSLVSHVEVVLKEFQREYERMSGFLQTIEQQCDVIKAVAAIGNDDSHFLEVSALATSFYYVTLMLRDFRDQIDKMIFEIDELVKHNIVSDPGQSSSQSLDSSAVDELKEKYLLYERKQIVDNCVTQMSLKKDAAFGLQGTDYGRLFENDLFWFYSIDHDAVGGSSPLTLNLKMYTDLPESPALHWHTGQLSVFACNCKYFDSKKPIHSHCVFLPKELPTFEVCDVFNQNLISFDVFLLQVQTLGWLDSVYQIPLCTKFPLRISSWTSSNELPYAMFLARSLSLSLLCEPIRIYDYLKYFWDMIWSSNSVYSIEMRNRPMVIDGEIYILGLKKYFDAKFFSEYLLNRFLESNIIVNDVYTQALNYLERQSSEFVVTQMSGELVNRALILLSLAYIYQDASKTQMDIHPVFRYCLINKVWTFDSWVPNFTQEEYVKFVAKVNQIAKSPDYIFEPRLDYKYDSSNGVIHNLKNYVDFVHTKTRADTNMYAAYFPIIQSSGSGKTRLIRQLMKFYPVYYICIRGPGISGSPPRSPCVAEYFKESILQAEYFEWIFMRILYHHLERIVENDVWLLKNNNVKHHCYGEHSFNTYSSTSNPTDCENLWKDVFDRFDTNDCFNFASKAFSPDSSTPHEMKSKLKSLEIVLNLENPENIDSSPLKVAIATIQSLATLIESKYKAGGYSPNGTHLQRPVFPLVVSVDEISEILPLDLKSNRVFELEKFQELQHSNLKRIRQAAASFKSFIVVTVMDTFSGLWLYSPPTSFDPSGRVFKRDATVFHPFIVFPFPRRLELPAAFCKYTDIVVDGKFRNSLTFNRFDMVLQSRPLFYGYICETDAFIESQLSDPDFDQDAEFVLDMMQAGWNIIINAAYSKLVDVTSFQDLKFNDSISSKQSLPEYFVLISIFAARFGVMPKVEGFKLSLIARNVATLREIDDSRQFAEVLYVMEPMIGEAATRAMNTASSQSVSAEVTATNSISKTYLFDWGFKLVCREALQGNLGTVTHLGYFAEVVAAMLFARAFDKSNMYAASGNDIDLTFKKRLPSQKDSQASLPESESSSNSSHQQSKPLPHSSRPIVEDGNIQKKFANIPFAGSPVTVYSWLSNLIKPEYFNYFTKFDNADRNAVPQALKSWIRILQFCQPSKRKLNRIDLAVYFSNYCAITCDPFTEGFDIVIPMALPLDRKEHSDIENENINGNHNIESDGMGVRNDDVNQETDTMGRDRHCNEQEQTVTKPHTDDIEQEHAGTNIESNLINQDNDSTNIAKQQTDAYASLSDIEAKSDYIKSFSGIFIQVTSHSEPVSKFKHAEFVKKLIESARDIIPSGPIVTVIMYMNSGMRCFKDYKKKSKTDGNVKDCNFVSICCTPDEIRFDMDVNTRCPCLLAKVQKSDLGSKRRTSERLAQAKRNKVEASNKTVSNSEANDAVSEDNGNSPDRSCHIGSTRQKQKSVPKPSTKSALEIDSKYDLNEVVHITCSGFLNDTFDNVLDASCIQAALRVIRNDTHDPVEVRCSQLFFKKPDTAIRNERAAHNPSNLTSEFHTAKVVVNDMERLLLSRK